MYRYVNWRLHLFNVCTYIRPRLTTRPRGTVEQKQNTHDVAGDLQSARITFRLQIRPAKQTLLHFTMLLPQVLPNTTKNLTTSRRRRRNQQYLNDTRRSSIAIKDGQLVVYKLLSLLLLLLLNSNSGVTAFQIIPHSQTSLTRMTSMVTEPTAQGNMMTQQQQQQQRSPLLSLQQSTGSSGNSESIVTEKSPRFGNVHGTNSCFLPLQQLEQDTYMPRIVHIVNGIYPSNDITIDNIRSTPKSECAPALGQWTYTFQTASPDDSDEIPVQASIALEGSNIVASCEDPVIVIAEHTALNILLPPEISEPVDLLVLIDRSKTYFSERKFLLYATPSVDRHLGDAPHVVHIAAFHSRDEIPPEAAILGQVEQVTIPWLPAMAPTKTGFLEADEYY